MEAMFHIRPGNIMAITATETGMGKTCALQNILVHNARKPYNRNVLLYSAEVTPVEFATTVTAHVLKRDLNEITLTDGAEAARILGNINFLIGNDPDLRKAMDVMDLIEAAIRRFGSEIVAIDHIHHICVNEVDQVKAQENVARREKDLCTKYKNIFIQVLQPRKADQNHKGKSLRVSDPRGAAALMDIAAGGITLHRDLCKDGGGYDPLTEVHGFKGRVLGKGKQLIKLILLGQYATFVPAAPQGVEEPNGGLF
jgi:archaellum biogenesis ATPase FlaH